VILRFGFNTGIHWAQEVTLYIAAWFVLFGASYGVKVGAHIGVDVLVKKLPLKLRRAVGAFAVVLCLIYCVLFLIGGWEYLSKMYKINIPMEDLPVPLWIAESILLIGFVLLVIRFLQLLWKIVKGEAEGFHLSDEAEESMHLAQELAELEAREKKA
jgi:C4-dicarboxylate transporter DctQ subunit